MPVDFASVISAGQRLVPDLQQQMAFNDQRRLINEQRALQVQAARDKDARLQQFRAAVAQAAQGTDPGAISRLMMQFPEFADQIKPGWEMLREEEKRANLTQIGSAYTRAMNGDPKGAAAILQRRYDADVAAGQGDEETKQLIDALNSDNPEMQRQASAMLGMRLAAYDPDKFSETYKALNPTEKIDPTQREYEWRVRAFGQEAADQWLSTQDTKLVPVQPGGSVYAYGGGNLPAPRGATFSGFAGGTFDAATGKPVSLTPGAKGGGQSISSGGGAAVPPTGAAIEQAALAAVPGLVVTSRQRSPGKNASVGGVQNSYHLTDQARDFVPPQGMGMGMLAKRLKDAMPGFDVINEGDHVHVEPSGKQRRAHVQQSKTVDGKRYFQIGGRWFDNPEGR